MTKPETGTIKPNLYDIKGYAIKPGDLIRTYHFTGKRGKIHYLYHVASEQEHGMRLLPVSWCDPNYDRSGGGSCYCDQSFLNGYSATIVDGDGLTDRTRREVA